MLSGTWLSFLVLSALVFSCRVLPCPVWSGMIWSYLVLLEPKLSSPLTFERNGVYFKSKIRTSLQGQYIGWFGIEFEDEVSPLVYTIPTLFQQHFFLLLFSISPVKPGHVFFFRQNERRDTTQ
jgi:hypothetical protein